VRDVAVWRSGSLPKWAGILLAPGIIRSMTLSPGVALAGALLLFISDAWLAGSVSQPHPGARADSAPSRSRVAGPGKTIIVTLVISTQSVEAAKAMKAP